MNRMLSLLFVPGDRAERFDKAAHSGADTIILDLEDAVVPERKSDARNAIRDWLAAGHTGLVRVNSIETEWFEDDLRMVLAYPGAGVMLPKAEPAAVTSVAQRLSDERVLVPLVESVRGVMELRAIASVQGVTALAFGSVDFALDSGMTDADDSMGPVRSQIVLESMYAGLAAPIDGVTVAVNDQVLVRSDAERARRFGFGGKLCIHPKQVNIVNDVFTPSAEQLDWARRVIAACDEHPGGAFALDGKMIDRPVVATARRLLAHAG